MESAHPPYPPADVVRVLTALGDQVQDRPELADRLPEDLVRSARRFVDLTGIDALPDEPVAVVATSVLTTAKLVEHLVRPGEVVNAGKLRGRLARAGRIVDTGYINTTLHRAWSRGSLDRVSHGHYSRVIRREDHGELSRRVTKCAGESPDRVAMRSGKRPERSPRTDGRPGRGPVCRVNNH